MTTQTNRNHFFITTPIYYSNAIPHVGHAYSSCIADVYARFHRMLGYEVKFSTGVDENSQKTVQAAANEGKEIHAYLDEYAEKHRTMWDALRISYTDFVRTTAPTHQAYVQKILQQVYDRGDIYQGEYKGLYCVGCESFKKESDLIDGAGDFTGQKVCPDHLKPCDQLTEQNRFFRLSAYQDKLLAFYEAHPDFIQPSHRYNEVLSFVKGGLEDFSISRETNKFGIPLPFDPDHVTYVWFDALLNYVSICQGGDEAFWSQGDAEHIVHKAHILGKDISRFHAIYWPAMLMSAELPLPDTEIITGFFTADGQKMSKSLGNVVNPVTVVEQYGRDALVYYLLNDMQIGSDGDFSWERFRTIFDTHLIGGWGNLVSRVTNIAAKNGINRGALHASVLGEITFPTTIADRKAPYLDTTDLQGYCQSRYLLVQASNELMQRTEPRKLFKDDATRDQAVAIIETLLYMIKQLAILISPMLLDSTDKVASIYGNTTLTEAVHKPEKLMDFYAVEEFAVRLTPGIVYSKVE